jgi:hypothetical protein
MRTENIDDPPLKMERKQIRLSYSTPSASSQVAFTPTSSFLPNQTGENFILSFLNYHFKKLKHKIRGKNGHFAGLGRPVHQPATGASVFRSKKYWARWREGRFFRNKIISCGSRNDLKWKESKSVTKVSQSVPVFLFWIYPYVPLFH